MPIYEYQCADCGAVFEVMQRISAPAPDKCPECTGGNLKKLISKVGFQLKGTGWYETDFKNKAQKTKKDPDGADGKKPSSSDKNDKNDKNDKKTPSKAVASKTSASGSEK